MKSAIVVIVLGLLLLGGCTKWKWDECRKVGHGAAYCVMDLGR